MNNQRQLRWLGCALLCSSLGACDNSANTGYRISGPSTNTSTSPNSSVTTTGGFAECEGDVLLDEGIGGGSFFDPGVLTQQEKRPPPISGGGLLVSRAGDRVVVSDPDRDRVFVVALQDGVLALLAEHALTAGAEPGRIAEGDGVAYVALRGTGELLPVTLATGEVGASSAVCDNPRGVAYDANTGLLHVACAEGRLVSLSPSGTAEPRALELADDLRDVVVDGDQLLVSRFRSAEVLRLDASGQIVARTTPPTVKTQTLPLCEEPTINAHSAGVAWRMLPAADGGALMLHQRAQVSPLDLEDSGSAYGDSTGCDGPVQSIAGPVDETNSIAFPSLAGTTLAVDVAVSPDQQLLAIAAPAHMAGSVRFSSLAVYDWNTQTAIGRSPEDPTPFFCQGPMFEFENGQTTSVAFTTDNRLLAFSREPARLLLLNVEPYGTTTGEASSLTLSTTSVRDSGHELFHADVGRGIACASCHPEATDDAHVWSFVGFGPRRTQQLRGGLLGTEPFHWEGDMNQFGDLMNEVMVRRMGGPELGQDYQDALAGWLHAQPALQRTGLDEAAVTRGRTLFESSEVGCASCHSGPMLTNNLTMDVGTGLATQVPSLVGVSFRAPFMHDGCAPSLTDRFGACGGGDQHGTTSHLSDAERSDLVTYLKSL